MPLPNYHFSFRHSLPSDSKSGRSIPSDIFAQLVPDTESKEPQTHTTRIENDWRHGPIQIDWIDFAMHKDDASRSKRAGPSNPTATFSSSGNWNTGTTSLPDGVVHIFRESCPIETDSHPSIDDESNVDGLVLGILAVPPSMTPSDFLAFVAPAAESIQHLRMIRDSLPNRTMVLLKFPQLSDAADFAEEYNGRRFTSLQPEICQVVRVTSVRIEAHDEVTLANARLSAPSEPTYELPTCPVCLDRMDSSVTGLVTVPCMHSFHCACLTKWGDSRCPVCRYSQHMLTTHRHSSSMGARRASVSAVSSSTLTTCWDCSSTTNLWICLICGNIGCGRYGRAHAQSHYEATTHLYALELETQRVWDYAGDGYVHRLIQNKADGKLVELPSAASMSSSQPDGQRNLGPGPSDNLTAEKIEAIGIEYSYLLTSQLDSQREYFEKDRMALKTQLDEIRRELESVKETNEQHSTRFAKEQAKLEKRAEKTTELARRLEKDLKEERAVSSGLMQNMTALKAKLELCENDKKADLAKIQDLEEQIRDLMFFVEAKDKIAQGGGAFEEAAGGSLQVAQTSKRKGKKS